MKMKTTFTMLLSACLMSSALIAQPVLTQAGFNFPAAPFNDTATEASSPASVRLPTQGANQTWDYSNINVSGRIFFTKKVAANANFPNADFTQEITTFFNGLDFNGIAYRGMNTNGFVEYGSVQLDTAFDLAAVSGSSSDTLFFTRRTNVYNQPFRKVALPLAYGDTWSDQYLDTVDFALTVGAFALNKTPGFNLSRTTIQGEVVGHGNVILPRANGTPTNPIPALLVEKVATSVDSFFLAGALAPPALLSAFSTSQGIALSDTAYELYTPNFPFPIMEFSTVGNSTSVYFRPRAENASIGLTAYKGTELQTYPNPVEPGGEIRWNGLTDGSKTTATIQVFDITGRIVLVETLQSHGVEHRISLPETLQKGAYQYLISIPQAASRRGSFIIK